MEKSKVYFGQMDCFGYSIKAFGHTEMEVQKLVELKFHEELQKRDDHIEDHHPIRQLKTFDDLNDYFGCYIAEYTIGYAVSE